MHSLVGVISDTHGLLRPEAVKALRDCELIIHAGDIGNPEVLHALRKIAPLIAIRGNVDRQPWAENIPETEMFEHRGRYFYLLHDLKQLDIDPVVAGIDAVIYGHSHQPLKQTKDGVLFFNPGSAGPRRFKLPICLGTMQIHESRISAKHVNLVT